MYRVYPKETKEYEIGIRFLSIGCVIRVGCKEMSFTNVDEVMDILSLYVKNPYEGGNTCLRIVKITPQRMVLFIL